MKPDEINTAFLWPKATALPVQRYAQPLYKGDSFLASIENLISLRRAWAPIGGSTRRVESSDKLSVWIAAQLNHKHRVDARLGLSIPVTMRVEDFPQDATRVANRTISTARNIAYLIDSSSDFMAVYAGAFQMSANRVANILDNSLGVFLYVCNSIESGGRAFSGDPFTGQAAAYSRIFAHDLFGQRVLNFVAYYPHQLYSQCFTQAGTIPRNKGVKMLSSQATLLITCGGVIIEPRQWSVVQ